MRNYLDSDGQPFGGFNRVRRENRSLHELIGLCKGILSDGKLIQEEAEFLQKWLRSNWENRNQWPANVLIPRLERMLSDGVLDQEERAELFELLEKITGPLPLAAGEEFANYATTLPLDDPPPPLTFEGKLFVLTGKFVTGSRRECTAAIEAMGGRCHPRIIQKVDYLVIGTMASRDWLHTSYGRKIEAAVGLREKGIDIAIISESYWVQHLVDL